MYGRAAEQTKIDQIVTGARAGSGGGLIVTGEAGGGKTALLDHAARAAEGMRVLRGAGYAAEAQHPYASLYLLVQCVQDRIDELPKAQAGALRAAFDHGAVDEEDHIRVRRAVLTLFCRLAAERPLLALVDDAQWLDPGSADALVFAARRLGTERAALLMAARAAGDGGAAGAGDAGGGFAAPGLAELRLGRLDRSAAAALLAAEGPPPAPPVRDRIIAESAGNPLALRTLTASLTPAQRAGRLNPYTFHDGTRAVAGQPREEFHARLRRLGRPLLALLLVAACDDTRDLGLVTAAAATLGAGPEELEQAERSGLLQVDDTRVAFCHPLMRMTAYHHATTTERRAARRALAAAAEHCAELRVWQLAAAATGEDAELSAELERIAGRGGGWRSYAAYERAAELTPDRRTRARRLAAAAREASQAGLLDGAVELAARAATLTDDPRTKAELAVVHAGVEVERGSPRVAGRTLVDGAALIASLDPAEALLMLAEAIRCAWQVDDVGLLVEVEAALKAVAVPPDSPLHALPPALSALVHGDPGDDLTAVEALTDLARDIVPGDLGRRLMTSSIGLGAAGGGYRAARAFVAECRTAGLTGRLPYALYVLAQAQLSRGRHGAARAAAEEGLEVAVETGQHHRASQLRCLLGWLAAAEGDAERCEALVTEGLEYAAAQGIVPTLAQGAWALALLDLGAGRYESALDRLEAQGSQVGAVCRAPDLVEAAARCGLPERAQAALALLEERGTRSHPPGAQAVLERCRGLVAAGPQARHQLAWAVRMHQAGDQPYERARSELAYGQWLRRARRRAQARPHLRSAAELFESLGARVWAGRARAELAATGGASATGVLTPQELQIVRLAATGASNRDIAARLQLSPRTVGNHLYRIFPKLGITGREQLRGLDLDAQPGGADDSIGSPAAASG